MKELAVIFDMDGVIVHTNPYHADAFKAFFDRYNIGYSDEELVEHMYGKHNSYILKHFFGREIAGEEFRTMEDEKEALFREIYRERVEEVRGFSQFLADLKQAGIPTGVATSAPRANMDLIIDALGIRSVMGSILASEDVERHKPDPEIYLRSAAALGVPPSHCVVFEDSHSGVTAALAAGTKVVGVLTSHESGDLPPCDRYIQDYREIDTAWIKSMI